MARAILALLLVLSGAALAEVDAGLHGLAEPVLKRLYARLLMKAWAGTSDYERGAFLVRTPEGGYALVPWEGSQFRRVTFSGVIPDETVAVVHTHPPGVPRPSQHDIAECRKQGLPFVVLSRSAIYAIDPKSGEVTSLDPSSSWFRRLP